MNRLANEPSAYLRQHMDNPVDWYPWGEEALALAREQQKPLLLSIGYSACHWCHVMAHESFEDPELQERTRLPHIEHPDYPGRLDWLILRLAGGQEQVVVQRLSPFIKAVREAGLMGEAEQS